MQTKLHPAQRRYIRWSILMGFLYSIAAPLPLLLSLDLGWTYFSVACVALAGLSFVSARHPEDRTVWFLHTMAKMTSAGLLSAWVVTHGVTAIPAGLAGLEILGLILVFILGAAGTGRKSLPGIPPPAPSDQ